jgi:hypothetical protein
MKINTLGKLSIASVLISAALSAQAGISVDNEKGQFSISGDVEFDINYRDKNKEDTQELNQDGRVLLNVAAERSLSDTRYIGVQVQPLLKTTGEVELDDAWVEFGQKQDWALKVGRYEAYDMFPVGQDTMLDFAGDGDEDGLNVYRMKDARGRGDNGQISYSKSFDSVYFEVSSLFKKRTEKKSDKNAVFVRPVVEFSVTDALKIAGAMEANLTAENADTDNDYMGYGATVKYSADDLSINVNYAYRDFDSSDKENSSAGANLLFKGFGLGYVYADEDKGNSDVKVNTVYASYQIANVMDVEDLSVYLGSYYSKVEDQNDKEFGARVRIKYFF